MATEKKVIIGVDLQAAQAVKAAAMLESKIVKLGTEAVGLRKNLKKLQVQEGEITAEREQQIDAIRVLSARYGENDSRVTDLTKGLRVLDTRLEDVQGKIRNVSTDLNQNKEATKAARTEQREFNKVAATTPETLARQRLELSSLKKQYANFRVGVDGSEKDLADLQARILSLNNSIKSQEQAVGVFGRNVGNYTNSIRDAFKNVGNLITGGLLVGGIQGVASAVQNLASETIALYDIQAKADAQLRASLESTRGAAGRTFEELKAQASELQGVTLFGDEQTQQAQSLLLTFTNVRTEVFDRSIPLIQDYATALAGASGGTVNLKDASIQVGKALNDPIKGISALGRAGVQFTDEQKELIKTLQDTGQTAEAQGVILAELEKQFGGSARAAAEAGAGGITQLENKIGDLKEQIGSQLLPIQEAATAAQLRFFEILSKGIEIFLRFALALKEIPAFIKENQVELAALGVALVTFNAASIAAAANTLRLAIAQKSAAITTRAFAIAQALLNTVLNLNPIGLIVTALAALTIGLVQAYKQSEKFRAVVQGVWAAVKNIISNSIEGIKNQLFGLANILIGAFTLDIEKVKAGFKQLGEGIKGQVTAIGKGTAQAFAKGYADQIDKEKLDKVTRARLAASELYGDLGSKAGAGFAEGLNEGIKNTLSVSGIEAQLSELKDAFNAATTDADRRSIAAEIGALEKRLKALKAPLEAAKKPSKDVEINQQEARKADITREIAIQEAITTTTTEAETKRNETILDLKRQLLDIEEQVEVESAIKKGESEQLVRELYNAKRVQITAENVKNLQEVEIKRIEQHYKVLESKEVIRYESQNEVLAKQLEEKLLTQEQYTDAVEANELLHEQRMREIRKEAVLLELEDKTLTDAERIAKEAELAALLAAIRKAEADAFTDTEKQKQDAIDETEAKRKQALADAQAEREAKEEIAGALIDSAMSVTQTVIDSTDEESGARKAALAVQKTLGIASVILDTQKRISAAALAGQKLAETLAFLGPAGVAIGAAYSGVQIALAVTQGAQRVAAISGIQFEEGGPLDNLKTNLAKAGGLAVGPSHADGGIPGDVNGTPIEFEGGEYIVRKESTKKNNDVIQRINQDKGRSRFALTKIYAEGGSVSPVTAPVAGAMMTEAVSSAQVADMITAAVRALPAPVVSVVEIADVTGRVAVKEGRARL